MAAHNQTMTLSSATARLATNLKIHRTGLVGGYSVFFQQEDA
jgi:hypothetical protein